MSPKQVQREFTRVRRLIRQVYFEHGFTLNHSAAPPELGTLISEVATQIYPTVKAGEKLEQRIEQAAGRDLMNDVSEHFGALISTHGDAGYFVGVCAGLELAALALGTAVLSSRTQKRGVRR